VDCRQYIENYLSADADDELSADERRLAAAHLTWCVTCRSRLKQEREIKASIRSNLAIVKAPADVRFRIRAALGELEHGNALRMGSVERGRKSRRSRVIGHSDGWLANNLRRISYLAPAALLVSVAMISSMLVVTGKRTPAVPRHQASVHTFDFAIQKFDELSQGFTPNVPAEAFSREGGAYFAWVEDRNPVHPVSDELPDISASYEKIDMPAELCDFGMAGYQLEGGRIDRLPDGTPITYTLYQNGSNMLLSIGLKRSISAPEGAYWFETHALYSYRGYSISLTAYPIGHLVSIIVTRAPMIQLLRDLAAADITYLDR
jgi:hypothetical protein